MVDDSDVVHISLSDVEISMIGVEKDFIVYDSGASISIFNDYGGHEKLVLPKKFVMTGNGRIETSSGFMHPLFGLVYVYEELPVNIVSAYEISHNPRYQVVPYPDDTRDVYDADGTVFYVRWRKKTLMIDLADTWNPSEAMQVNIGVADVSYEELDWEDEEYDEACQYFDEERYLNLYQENLFNRSVDILSRGDIASAAVVSDFDYLKDIPVSKLKLARAARHIHRTLGFRPAPVVARLINRGFLVNVPIDATILRATDELLGRPHEFVKGNMKRRKTRRFRFYDEIKDHDLAIEIDIMYFMLHEVLMGVTIPHAHSYAAYLGTRKAKHKTAETLMVAAKQMIQFYISYGWTVKYIVFDGERAMCTPMFMNMVRRFGARPISLAHGDHCHRIERRQGVIKSMARTIKASFPTSMPVSLVPHLLQHAVFQINFNTTRSNKDERPPYLAITGQSSIDYGRWFRAAFGDFIQVFKNDQVMDKSKEMSMDAIALYPGESAEEGWHVLSIDTGRVVKRSNFLVCTKYSERAIRFLADLALADLQGSIGVERHPMDIDRVEDVIPRVSRELIADPLEVEGSEDPVLGAFLVEEVDEVFTMVEDDRASEHAVLTSIWQEAEAEALVFLAQYSMLKGISMYGTQALEAVKAELGGLIENLVGDPVRWQDVPARVRKKVIPTKVIITEKIKDGILDKLKARLVVLGNLQKADDDENLRAPTPSITTVMIQGSRAAAEGRVVITFDVSQAFLNADIDDEETYVRLPRRVAEVLVSIDSGYQEYLCDDGSMIMKLLKALYGLRKAPKLWRDTFRAVLIEDGYKETSADECLYVKFYDDSTSTDVSIHVDDGYLTTSNLVEAEKLIEKLGNVFKLKVTRGPRHLFLGLQFDFNYATGDVMITQPDYVMKIVGDTDYRVAETPHTAELFAIDVNAKKLSEEERKKFHTSVAKCLYLALRTRPDILVAVNFLTTRVNCATTQDVRKLNRLIGYLKFSAHLGIKLGGDSTGKYQLFAYADAAYGVHSDAKSHTGLFFSFGRGPVYVKSGKQRCVTRSSCEAELIALSDLTSLVLWLDHLFFELSGRSSKPITLYEDNTAVIHIVNNGMATSDRARHIHIRNNFVHQFITAGDIIVIHCGTHNMIADILTKPLTLQQFLYLRDYLLGYAIPQKGCVELSRAHGR